jgi:hypothetical protein
MPQFSRLKTFRESGDELMRARKRPYFRWWNVLSLRSWVVIACIVFLLTLVVDTQRRHSNVSLVLFSGCLCALGVIMVLLNCFCVQLLPRFILPAMEFTLISIMILLALIFTGYEPFE